MGNLSSFSGEMAQDSLLQDYYELIVSNLYRTDIALENLNFQFMATAMDITDTQILNNFKAGLDIVIELLDTLMMNLEDYETKITGLEGSEFVNIVNLS